jgi:EpsI family protein
MGRTQAIWITAAIIAAAGIAARSILATEPADPGPLHLERVSLGDADSAYVDESLDSGFEETLRAREILYRTYEPDSDAPVWVFLAWFDRQREGSQVHSPRHCYPGAGWSIEREVEQPASWRAGTLHGMIVSDGDVRRLVCYWYQTPGGILSDVFRLKIALTRQAVLRGPQDVVFANVSTAIDHNDADAWARIAPLAEAAENQVALRYRERDANQ